MINSKIHKVGLRIPSKKFDKLLIYVQISNSLSNTIIIPARNNVNDINFGPKQYCQGRNDLFDIAQVALMVDFIYLPTIFFFSHRLSGTNITDLSDSKVPLLKSKAPGNRINEIISLI